VTKQVKKAKYRVLKWQLELDEKEQEKFKNWLNSTLIVASAPLHLAL
jgi:hypothetical protein